MERFIGIVKVFVVVAGLAIVLGAGALGYLLIQRSTKGIAAAALPTAAPRAEHRSDLALPQGAIVIDMQLSGTDALLLLRSTDGNDYLALIEPATGRRVSLMRLVPDPG